MEGYTWTTEEPHCDNSVTMGDYLINHLPEHWRVDIHDGSYAEVFDPIKRRFEVHASGNGDFYSHKVEFVPIDKGEW